MSRTKNKENIGLIAGGTIASLLGALVIVGWLLGNTTLIQVLPRFVPMQFNTALSFFILGLTLIALGTRKCVPSILLALPLFVLALVTTSLLQYILVLDFGIDQIFISHSITTLTSHPGRMSPMTAVCFILTNIASIVLLSKPTKMRETLLWILALLTFAFSVSTIIGYLSNYQASFGWQKYTRMAVHTALGFFCVSIGTLTTLIPRARKIDDFNWLPIPIGSFVLLSFILLGQALKQNEFEKVKHSVQDKSRATVSEMNIYIKQAFLAFNRLSERLKFKNEFDFDFWRKDADSYLQDFLIYQAIERIDEKHTVRWVQPLAGNEKILGFDNRSSPARLATFETARLTKTPVITKSFQLLQGGRGFLYIYPLFRGDTFLGSSLAVIRIETLFKVMKDIFSQGDMYVEVIEDGEIIFTNRPEKSPVLKDVFIQTHQIDSIGANWQIKLIPSDEYISKIESRLPEMVILLGLIIAIISGLTAHFNFRSRKFSHVVNQLAERYDLALAGVGVGVWDWDVTTGAEIWNDAFYHLIGYRPNELPASLDSFKGLLHPDDISRTWGKLEQHFAGKGKFRLEYRLLTKNEGYKWFKGNGKAQFDKESKPVRMVGSIENIDDQMNLAIIQERLLDIIDSSTDLILQLDTDLNVTFTNNALKRLIGSDHLNNLSLKMIFSEDVVATLKERVFPLTVEQGYWEGQLDITNRSTIIIPTIASVIAQKDDLGEVIHFSVILKDISEIKHREKELEQFAFIASHDLKAPLRHVRSFVGVLQEEIDPKYLNDEAKKAIHYIMDGTNKMKILIEDLLDYSRVQSNPIEYSECNLNQLLEDVQDVLSEDIKEASGKLIIEKLPTIECDRLKIFQVFQNLIGNGLKYTAPGVTPEVRVYAKVIEDQEVFVVEDNGIGIPRDKHEYVFQIFKRLHTAAEYTGTGIGLAIVKKIIDRHGGKIWVESIEGQGSKFNFVIPSKLS